MGKPKILITHPLVFVSTEELESIFEVRQLSSETPINSEQLSEEILGKDGVICLLTEIFNDAILETAKDLKVISSVSAGLDHIDLKGATERGIYVTNTPTALTDSVAEFAVAIMLAVARRVVEGDRIIRNGEWRGGWGLTYMLGRQLKGKTVGIVGLGRIGTAVATKLRGFDVGLRYYSRTRRVDVEKGLGIIYAPLDDLLRASDFVIVCVSLNDQTRKMIGERELSLMKSTSYLVNVSRGAVIEESALIRTLKERKIAGAALDVFEKEPIGEEHELAALDNVVLCPHIGSATVEARKAMVLQAVDNMVSLFRGISPPNLANPEVMKTRTLDGIKML